MLRFSEELVNFLQVGGSFKEAFEDAILEIYSGSQPATADAAATGTKLVEITLSGEAFTYGTDYSLPRIDELTISSTNAGTNSVTIGGIEIQDTTSGSETVADIAKRMARKIEVHKETTKIVIATYIGSGKFVIRSRVAGNDYTLSVSGNVSTSSVQAASRVKSIQFGDVSEGSLQKESGEWKGNGLVDGTAGWFRMKGKNSEYVMDGNIGTYGADLNLVTTSISSGVPITISTFTITQPKQA